MLKEKAEETKLLENLKLEGADDGKGTLNTWSQNQ